MSDAQRRASRASATATLRATSDSSPVPTWTHPRARRASAPGVRVPFPHPSLRLPAGLCAATPRRRLLRRQARPALLGSRLHRSINRTHGRWATPRSASTWCPVCPVGWGGTRPGSTQVLGNCAGSPVPFLPSSGSTTPNRSTSRPLARRVAAAPGWPPRRDGGLPRALAGALRPDQPCLVLEVPGHVIHDNSVIRASRTTADHPRWDLNSRVAPCARILGSARHLFEGAPSRDPPCPRNATWSSASPSRAGGRR